MPTLDHFRGGAPLALAEQFELAALTPRERATLVQARRDYHSDLPLANTPVMRKLLATGRLLVQLNRGQISARRGMILSGASGTGKTTALTQLGRTHERAVRKRHPGRAGEDRIPVVYVTVPTDATPKMLAVECAQFYGVEFSLRATMPDIVNTVCAVAARTHLELVLIDEIHNILDNRAEVSDQLKYFAELPATFAYARIEVEERGMFAGPRSLQIAGRFTLIDTTPFDYGTPEQKTAWRALIATLEQSLRLHQHRPGTLVELADYLYERTGAAPARRGRADGLPPAHHRPARAPGDRRLLPRPARRPARHACRRPLAPQVSRPKGNGNPTRRLDGDLLATVANQPRQRLDRAIVELITPEPDWLALRHQPQLGCRRCDARHRGGPVLHLLGHHTYVCTRHQIWIGPPDQVDHPQPTWPRYPKSSPRNTGTCACCTASARPRRSTRCSPDS